MITPQAVAKLSLLGMGLDVLGGCYLAYDLLGGKRGPLRTIARAAGYVALFFIGYVIVLGLRFAVVAAGGMGILLVIEYRLAGKGTPPRRPRRVVVLLLGFLRGVVLGLASMTIAGPAFGIVFGTVSGVGLAVSYAFGFAPTDDYEADSKPRTSKHKIIASLWRAVAISVGGLIGVLPAHQELSPLLGLKLGFAAGAVSAFIGLFSPAIEWWAESLPERKLGVAGLGLILLGMAFQSVQYWLVVLGAPLR